MVLTKQGVLHAFSLRSPKETIGQQGAQGNHLSLSCPPNAHVPLPSNCPEEKIQFENGETFPVLYASDCKSTVSAER